MTSDGHTITLTQDERIRWFKRCATFCTNDIPRLAKKYKVSEQDVMSALDPTDLAVGLALSLDNYEVFKQALHQEAEKKFGCDVRL
jgi:hypothetical protein